MKCFDIGVAGNCGLDCPVFLNGLCENADEVEPEEIIKFWGHDEAIEIIEIYGEYEEWLEKYRAKHPEEFI